MNCGDIPLHSPYIGLIYGRYLQFRFLRWPVNECQVYMSYYSLAKWEEVQKWRHEVKESSEDQIQNL